MKSTTLSVPDMQSAHCQMRVRTALQPIAGITTGEIASGVVTLEFEDESRLKEAAKAIEAAGYTVVMPGSETPQTYQFKTNINCGGCVAAVEPFLNKAEGVCYWSVDTQSRDKILTVSSNGISPETIEEVVEKAGFRAAQVG
jgi:copper chaperone CopZ